MSLCELSASHDAKPPVGTTDVRSRKIDHPGIGRSAAVNNGGLYAPAGMTGGRQSHSNANAANNNPSGQNNHCPSSEFPHPGMKFIDANKTASNGNNHPPRSDVPFAPRPATTQQLSGAQHPTFPYSSFHNPSGAVPVRTHGRSSQTARSTSTSTSRKPVPTQPLASTAVGSAPASTPKFPGAEQATSDGAATASGSGPRHRMPSNKPHPSRTEPKKRPLPAVMEINKIMIPKGFLPAAGEKSGEDLYAKLPTLWSKTGNPNDIYVNWTNPDAPSPWELTKIHRKESPAIPPPPGTPLSFSSESSVSSAAVSPQTTSTTRRTTRSRGASVVSEVYADSRYIGVAPKRAKLMHQSSRTRTKLGPLDQAHFRDYRLLPIDYFVAPMEGFQQAEQSMQDDDNKEEGGRPRRRRRPPQQTQAMMTPPKEKKKKKRQVTKTSVFVGKNHQVDCLPRPTNTGYKVDPSIYQDSSYKSDDVRDEQIWDPQRADAAQRRGEDIEGFLLPARELNSQALLLQALHQADYCVSKAELKFVDLYRVSKEPSTELSDKEKAKADSMFETSRKDFGTIAKALNRSVGAVLAQYYYWKSMEKKEGSGGYARLKTMWKNEDDHCCICDDGGMLIVCEHCHKAFHLECLKPPLKEAPKTDWYCSQCLKSPAKLRRLPSLSLGTLSDSDDVKPSAAKALPFSTEGIVAGPVLPFLEQHPGWKNQADDRFIDLTDD